MFYFFFLRGFQLKMSYSVHVCIVSIMCVFVCVSQLQSTLHVGRTAGDLDLKLGVQYVLGQWPLFFNHCTQINVVKMYCIYCTSLIQMFYH